MTNSKKEIINQFIEPKLIKRLRIYTVLIIIMLAVIGFEVINSPFTLTMAIIALIIGFIIGRIISRIYHFQWDDESQNVIGRIDWIGGAILLFYIVFVLTRARYLGYWIHGTPLFAFILSLTTGTFLGRVMGSRRGIKKILNAAKIN